ncbi:MAG: T9SS type A sorting domain-containing protein, partial [Bacteroidetes bacterium]|nr:T9SS type A sorting domain-containing protein [Bacteroidota bacterium]
INFYSIDGTNNYYLDDVVVDGDPAVGLTEFVEGNFRIYPNPTGGLFTVEGQENIEAVVVRNVLGATVAQLQSNFSNRVELDLTGLNNGLYFVEITVNDVVSVQRLIKQ